MGSTKIESPSTPKAPTAAETAEQYAAALPIYWENQLKYAPMEAQQQVDLASKYALPLAQAYRQANDILYPGTSGLQEQLAAQAQAGMTAGLTDAEKQQYQSDLAAQLGSNVGSGIGADYMSRNMLMQQQNRQDYFRNLALSTAGRQPLTTAQPVNSLNYMQNYTPTANANFVGQGYGNYSYAYSSMYGANANLQGSQNQMYGQIIGGAMGGAGTLGAGMMMKSSQRYKDNVVLWA
jgi:hypothetical protein